jgi:hypothetical protein
VTPKSHGGGEGKPPAPKPGEGSSDMTSALLRAKDRARKKM